MAMTALWKIGLRSMRFRAKSAEEEREDEDIIDTVVREMKGDEYTGPGPGRSGRRLLQLEDANVS
jgi:hypothetical protein